MEAHHISHVLDLPQLYTKPSAAVLLQALDLLELRPRDFSSKEGDDDNDDDEDGHLSLNPVDVTGYLTSIVSSSLSWLENDDLRDEVWSAASLRICERSGRSAMPDLRRSFTIPRSSSCNSDSDPKSEKSFTITLNEPSLTSDNLGNKTWVSSYLLSKRLNELLVPPPADNASERAESTPQRPLRALELGAGTGLVGLSFAAIWGSSATIHLTDLDAIVPNLASNVSLNEHLLSQFSACVSTGALDWSLQDTPSSETNKHPLPESETYDVILAADPLYSPHHPAWIVNTVYRYLRRNDPRARVIMEMPLRTPYLPQIQSLKDKMNEAGLKTMREGEEIGYDDWQGRNGEAVDVRCWWSIWRWK